MAGTQALAGLGRDCHGRRPIVGRLIVEESSEPEGRPGQAPRRGKPARGEKRALVPSRLVSARLCAPCRPGDLTPTGINAEEPAASGTLLTSCVLIEAAARRPRQHKAQAMESGSRQMHQRAAVVAAVGIVLGALSQASLIEASARPQPAPSRQAAIGARTGAETSERGPRFSSGSS